MIHNLTPIKLGNILGVQTPNSFIEPLFSGAYKLERKWKESNKARQITWKIIRNLDT
jgi:hypothetical protein